jgi:transcriptional regulator NrdR family protein
MRNNYSLYFTKPEQLLDIFNEMEEKSLPLIQKSQYTSEILDKIQSDINLTITEENQQVEQLQIKINQLEELIKHEIEREISCQNILMYFFF